MTNHTIYGTYFQTATPVVVRCMFCLQQVAQSDATTGPADANGQLTFICNLHLRDTRQTISGLADFRAAQRERLLQAPTISEADLDAWFSY